MLQNYMEILLEDVLKDVLKKYDLNCSCERCMEDIRAITLNNLKPIYVASDKGIVYTKLNDLSVQFKADIICQIMAAIKKVEEKPRH
ncbi:late competence development ComFB family protein [Tissierella creatinophila]|uniref:Late competence development protein ComFB n=1 Tax=Tissierella creatinophila DSM 6911 TaxID=1123403 RepID=A0A1U7M7F0_TISCR|nr:late competence development ComFB family protein [Tissierella creatinophila]OLS03180.1 late competence development protein ComFB [Tissierella creatinophila DSM 6911]